MRYKSKMKKGKGKALKKKKRGRKKRYWLCTSYVHKSEYVQICTVFFNLNRWYYYSTPVLKTGAPTSDASISVQYLQRIAGTSILPIPATMYIVCTNYADSDTLASFSRSSMSVFLSPRRSSRSLFRYFSALRWSLIFMFYFWEYFPAYQYTALQI